AVVIVSGHAGLPVIFALSIASAVCLGVSNPTGLAVVKQLVRSDQVKQATSQNQIRFFGATVAGPPIGGSLFGGAPALPFLGAALFFLVGAGVSPLIPAPLEGGARAQGFFVGGTMGWVPLLFRLPSIPALLNCLT